MFELIGNEIFTNQLLVFLKILQWLQISNAKYFISLHRGLHILSCNRIWQQLTSTFWCRCRLQIGYFLNIWFMMVLCLYLTTGWNNSRKLYEYGYWSNAIVMWKECKVFQFKSCSLSHKITSWSFMLGNEGNYILQWPLLLTWFNFNPSMDK